MNRTTLIVLYFAALVALTGRSQDPLSATPVWTLPDAFLTAPNSRAGWPAAAAEARPGAYWWWPGGAVTKAGITYNLETYRKAGWGNMGVVGIYGVKGEEDRFLDIFSPGWFEMFNHAVHEAERLDMNLDLTPSSGWRLGGPHITPSFAEQSFSVKGGRIESVGLDARVKRAGPGGQGLCLNPYSLSAVQYHFDWLSDRFREGNGVSPRAFYYDSFENPGNWCPEFPVAFRELRGYDLSLHAKAFGGRGDPGKVRRVMCDYRETLSDLLLECVREIAEWSAQKGSGLRMQAHGAPANLLDMYAAASIPETEVFGANEFNIPGYRRDPDLSNPETPDILVNRFASSAAHVAGHNLIISESFTWLRNHFHTALSHIKAESDQLFLNGINGIYYHGLCYSPKDADWPGWLFYASTQANFRNSIFRDIPALNAYITRCQSVLQKGEPHQDVLLYWPVYDLWMGEGSKELRFRVHEPHWLKESACGEAARWMVDSGYAFDYISDQQILQTAVKDGTLVTEGGSSYKTLLVPAAGYMPIPTLKQLLKLAREGASLLFWKQLPEDVPGCHDLASRQGEFKSMQEDLPLKPGQAYGTGTGLILLGENLGNLLDQVKIDPEPMVREGLSFTRRKLQGQTVYFLANHTAARVDGWIGLACSGRSALVMDPMTGRSGKARIRSGKEGTEVYLQVEPGETRIVRLYEREEVSGEYWPVLRSTGDTLEVAGPWHIEFTEGGPRLPGKYQADELASWTDFNLPHVRSFAGAARYSVQIEGTAVHADHLILDLGDVRESARVWVNGQPAGILVAHPFRLDISHWLKAGTNTLSIEVTNLSANRIRDLDSRGVGWKKFHDINIVDHLYQPFDASEWPVKPSGLLGPVRLIHCAELDPYTNINQ
jgi:hypothetical protein